MKALLLNCHFLAWKVLLAQCFYSLHLLSFSFLAQYFSVKLIYFPTVCSQRKSFCFPQNKVLLLQWFVLCVDHLPLLKH